MKSICSRCLYSSDHPFGLTFLDGVCSGCMTHCEKYEIDWDRQWICLEEYCRSTTLLSNSHYTCVVPVSGYAEDYFVLQKVLELGLKPLVVAVNNFFMNDIGWHNLHNLITHFDVDSQMYSPDISTYKELICTSLKKNNDILWPSVSLKNIYPVHVALERNIPLIIWGQNQAIEQVGKFSHYDKVEMTRWTIKEHDQRGIDIDLLIGTGAELDTRTINYYRHPQLNKLRKKAIRGLYLNNYIYWDPIAQNKSSVEDGFKPEFTFSTFDPYERAGCSVYYQVHDLLRLINCGYRKVDDHLSREVRHRRISKSEACFLSAKFRASKVDIRPFFDWLGVSKSGVDWIVEQKLSPFSHLISSEPQDLDDFILPSQLSEMVSQTYRSSESFIPFGKGI